MNTQYTPTPYRQVRHTIWSGAPDTTVGPVAEVSGTTVEEAEATAEFIVRACNSHDDLLAALKASVLKLHKIAYPISVEHTIEFEDCRAPECVQARDAIAKAELPA